MAESSKRQKTAGCSKRQKMEERKEETNPVGSSIVSKLVEMMKDISHGAKEVFLWYIVREAMQGLHRMRCKAYFDTKKIADPRGRLFIELIIDKSNHTLCIVDNGIGVTEDYLRTLFFNLPEISVKECEAIIDKLKLVNKKKEVTVDEFYVRENAGLGFLGAYMVADKVQITAKHYGGDTLWTLFSSPRDCLLSLESCTDSSVQAGTRVTLHLKEDHSEYLDEHRLKVLIDKYSFDLCPFPISIRVLPCGDIIQRSADLVVVTKKEMELMKSKFEHLRKVFLKVLDAWVKKVVVSDRIFDLPTYLSLDGKTLEINPRCSMMETLRQRAECDPEDEEVVEAIRAQFFAGVYSIQDYDMEHKTKNVQRLMKWTFP